MEAEDDVVTRIYVNNEGSGYETGDTITIAAAVAGTNTDVTAKIAYIDFSEYLTSSSVKTDYKVITVQDTSIIVNSSIEVKEQDKPTTWTPHKNASIEVQYLTVGSTYTLEVTINGVKETATYTTSRLRS